MRLGYNTWSAPTLAFDDAVRELARIGYDSVEITVCEGWPTDALTSTPVDAQRWRDVAAGAGLEISSVTANTPVVCDAETWAQGTRRMARSFDLAAVLGAGRRLPVSLGAHIPKGPLLAGSPPPITAQTTWVEHRQLIVDRFGELALLAESAGCDVALEPHAGAVVSMVDQALDVVASVDSPRLGINLDISHFAVRDFDLAEVVRRLRPHALVVEVKDHVRTGEGFDFLIPGEGVFDYVAFLSMLNQEGYQGTVSVEISVRRQALLGFDAVAAAQSSYDTLAAAFVTAGIERPQGKLKGPVHE